MPIESLRCKVCNGLLDEKLKCQYCGTLHINTENFDSENLDDICVCGHLRSQHKFFRCDNREYCSGINCECAKFFSVKVNRKT